MRKTILAILLSGAAFVPAAARAQPDGGAPDGAAGVPRVVAQQDERHTGYSNDPQGNMGDEGRTGKEAMPPDAGTTSTGAEGASGSSNEPTTVPDKNAEPNDRRDETPLGTPRPDKNPYPIR